MAPDIIVVRHGQAEHNVAFDAVGDTAYEDARYRDSKLTHAGVLPLQCLRAMWHLEIICKAFRQRTNCCVRTTHRSKCCAKGVRAMVRVVF